MCTKIPTILVENKYFLKELLLLPLKKYVFYLDPYPEPETYFKKILDLDP